MPIATIDALISAARCDRDLSGGAVTDPRSRGAGRKKRRLILGSREGRAPGYSICRWR